MLQNYSIKRYMVAHNGSVPVYVHRINGIDSDEGLM